MDAAKIEVQNQNKQKSIMEAHYVIIMKKVLAHLVISRRGTVLALYYCDKNLVIVSISTMVPIIVTTAINKTRLTTTSTIL